MNEQTKAIVARAGGAKALAERLGITKAAIYQWDKVPSDRALAVARAARMPVEEVLEPCQGAADGA